MKTNPITNDTKYSKDTTPKRVLSKEDICYLIEDITSGFMTISDIREKWQLTNYKIYKFIKLTNIKKYHIKKRQAGIAHSPTKSRKILANLHTQSKTVFNSLFVDEEPDESIFDDHDDE
jgi:hypothetical protein